MYSQFRYCTNGIENWAGSYNDFPALRQCDSSATYQCVDCYLFLVYSLLHMKPRCVLSQVHQAFPPCGRLFELCLRQIQCCEQHIGERTSLGRLQVK